MELNKDDYLRLKRNNYNSFKDIANIVTKLVFGRDKEDKEPLISYIIPTFCRPDTLIDAIQSILMQEEKFPYEVLIVDNSADFTETNETRKLISTINDSHIKYFINTSNIGQVGNWNRAFELARGKYVSMLHDDDLLVPDYSIKILQYISMAENMSDNVGVIKGRRIYFNDGETLPIYKAPRYLVLRRFYQINSMAVAGIGPTSCPTCGIIFRKDAVIQAGGFCDKFFPSHDYVLGHQILKEGYRVYTADDDWGYYRVGIGESSNRKMMQSFVKADYYFREYLYSQNVFTKLFGKVFRDVQYTISINDTIKNAARFGFVMEALELEFRKGYNPSSKKLLLFEWQRKQIRKITGKPHRQEYRR